MSFKIDFILNQINDIIDNSFATEKEIGVHSGLSGLLLFKYYYSDYFKLDFLNDKTNLILNEVVNRINRGEVSLTFCSGLAGFGWVLNHLSSIIKNFDADNYLKDIEEILVSQMRNDMAKLKYDFLHGAMGYGYYFLQRYNTTLDSNLKTKYKSYIVETIEFIKNIGENDKDGIKWPMENNQKLSPKIFNFGLAHGIPSIIFYLTEAYQAGINKANCKKLIYGGVKYLLNNEIHSTNSISMFPTGIRLESDYNLEKDISRLAWCYGDLGIASVLLNASIVFNDAKLRNKALVIAEHSTKRLDPIENEILDVPFCHGAFGVSHIFKSIYNKTNINNYKKSSEYWLNYGISFYEKNNDLEGFKSLDAYNYVYFSSLGVLEGLSGIGLVLISSIHKEQNAQWEKCLML